MFWRKKFFSSGDHAYEVAKCFRFDSQRIVKGVRWGDHCWRLFPCSVCAFLWKPQFLPPRCRKALLFEILYQIIQNSFHCLISLAFPPFYLKKLLSIVSFTKIWRFLFVTFGPCYINNIPILKLTTMIAIWAQLFLERKPDFRAKEIFFDVLKHQHCCDCNCKIENARKRHQKVEPIPA